jgi:16S rRNA A1518/A1519 N6-dimethyltransferase RsmA/KsgA/DIM1 with predicted DNA glycosylase/AP lyase activity
MIFTPVTIAKFLTNWAVCNKDESVLDIGNGEGIFTIEVYKRLQDLGAFSDQPAINPSG